MNLSNEQKAAVAEWVRQGENLSDVQKRIQAEFGVLMTYMDVRFLVDDLDLELSDKPPAHFVKKEASQAASPQNQKPASPAPMADTEVVEDDSAAAGGGSVSVTLDQIARPGALVSGSVTFSDGVNAQWHLDQMGRLALNAATPGYKPSQQDVMQFQMELQRLVEERGAF